MSGNMFPVYSNHNLSHSLNCWIFTIIIPKPDQNEILKYNIEQAGTLHHEGAKNIAPRIWFPKDYFTHNQWMRLHPISVCNQYCVSFGKECSITTLPPLTWHWSGIPVTHTLSDQFLWKLWSFPHLLHRCCSVLYSVIIVVWNVINTTKC